GKARRVEAQGLLARRFRAEVALARLEGLQRARQALDALFSKPGAGRGCRAGHRQDGLGGAAAPEGDHGRPAGLRLDRHDAEIFFAGEDQRATAAHLLANYLVRLPAEEMNGWARQRAQMPLVLAGADDEQVPAQAIARLDGQVEALV